MRYKQIQKKFREVISGTSFFPKLFDFKGGSLS